jgi:uncharacterized protein
MKNVREVENKLAGKKKELKQRFSVRSIRIFGSYIKGKQTTKSDLDVLVDLEKPIGIFGLMELEDYLRKLVGIKVDLVTKNTLKPSIKKEILKEAVYV